MRRAIMRVQQGNSLARKLASGFAAYPPIHKTDKEVVLGWNIKCNDSKCEQETWAENIVDLIGNHTDPQGWFVCLCGKHGYIEKSFDLQEPGEVWEPYLRGVVSLGQAGNTYQPFVFLVSYEPAGVVTDVWFSYYKDLRPSGGRLKLGYGPGGPPVLGKADVLKLLSRLAATKYLTKDEVVSAVVTDAV